MESVPDLPAAAADCPRLEESLCFAIYSANHAFTAAYRPLLEPLGLTYPQYLVLLVLWEGGEPGVKEIGARLHLDSGTLTPLLKRMEAAGLLRRERSAEDERQVRIRLTEKGRELRARTAGVQDGLCRALGNAGDALAVLRADLAGVAARLRAGAERG